VLVQSIFTELCDIFNVCAALLHLQNHHKASIKYVCVCVCASPGVLVEEGRGQTPTPTQWVALSSRLRLQHGRPRVLTITVSHLGSLLSPQIAYSSSSPGNYVVSVGPRGHKLPCHAGDIENRPSRCTRRSFLLFLSLLRPSGSSRGRRPTRNSHHAEPRRWVTRLHGFILRWTLRRKRNIQPLLRGMPVSRAAIAH